jgi:ketosteroid isomerase-like protein
MPFTGSVEDRLAVRELYGSYSGAGFAGDREAWLLCWADDPVWDTPAGKGEGVAALTAIWDGLWSGIEVMAFSAEVVSIEVDGDRAKSRAYCREVSNWKDGRKVKIIGRYDDDLVRTPLGWRFQRRKFTMHIEE